MSVPDPITSQPPQFSTRPPRPLWIGLATVVLIVVGLGLRVYMPIYRQQVAIREIERLKGTVVAAERQTEWLRNRIGNNATGLFEDVLRVELSNSKVKDTDLVWLTALPNIEVLRLVNTKMTDKGLIHVRALAKLQELELGRTQITDAGMDDLKSLTRLNRLGLGFTAVTDAGLACLSGLSELRELDLSGTQISNAGLAHLARLPNLRFLCLNDTKVTDAGVADLQRALPGLTVLM